MCSSSLLLHLPPQNYHRKTIQLIRNFIETVMSSPASSSPPPPASSCVQFRPEQLQLGTGIPLGSGAISQVIQCRLRCASAPFLPVVVKIVSKIQVLQQGKVQSVMCEKATLQRLSPFPYVVRLYGTAQSEDELYFVLEWLPHGDLLQHIRYVVQERVRQYNEKEAATRLASIMSNSGTVAGSTAESLPDGAPVANVSASTGSCKRVKAIPTSSTALRCLDFHDIQLITAQLVLALEHTANRGVVLRDLKPENVAFDEKYRACLLDFDTADLEGVVHMPETNGGVACPPPVDAAAIDEVENSNDSNNHAAAENDRRASSAPRRRLTVSQIQGMRRKTASFCGTAQYVSPEMLGECKWSFSSDLWALGALVYELMYGEHLFSGMTQFEVLQKVAHGGYAETQGLFPLINFDDDADGEAEQCGTGCRFAAVKDFIQQLLVTDPQKRLGVHPDTHCFDAAALRRHALFDGFQWEPVEEQLRTFRMRRFDLGGPKVTSTVPGDASVGAREASSDASSAALKSLAAACVDPSASLASCYHILPFNDPAYAEYVYHATADANPFEQFFTREDTETAPTAAAPNEDTAASHEAAGSASGSASGAVPIPAMDSKPVTVSAVGEDEMDDVIDDVGMHYTGHPADKDFQD
ncbi:protein kinase, putative [Leishmania tarentolae]|uniref:non-specific serine/threonine protein kinase n=1 Tax=Leishmania tarentolae TaxID=5689 RepID=A0A640KNR4_LEITA|nr:protein kinase, putative [Leishmania tarentolae]